MGSKLIELLWVTPAEALAVVISACVLYAVLIALVSLFWQSLQSRVSVGSVAILTLIGAITARSILGEAPRLAGGLLALATLLVLESIFNQLRRLGLTFGLKPRRAKAVMTDGQIVPEMLQRARLSERELYVRLRRAGVRQLSEVATVIVETDGSLTVIRVGQDPDEQLLAGVLGL
ncbi:MAG: DUF421 domain-containing protein [Propionibacteriaceae bacterium]|jgi:uncharacterized membrane protein YcaP (DUF421 family)|nr:DUF421 domain-containing protein [Propionibacteriaceae bacterium]